MPVNICSVAKNCHTLFMHIVDSVWIFCYMLAKLLNVSENSFVLF